VGNVRRLYTLSEVEQMCGYAKNTLTSARAKGQMPEPDAQYGRTPLWAQQTIDRWLQTRNRRGNDESE
jgi:predicted DNA-binding transcriptional regulator AlpA